MRCSARLPGLLVLLVILSACSTPAVSPTASDDSSAPAPASASPRATSSSQPSDEATPSATPTATDEPSDATLYTVRRGDTLASISRAYSTTTQQLQAWNVERYPSLATDPNVIEPGWELIVAGDPNVTPRPTPTPAPATPRPTPPPSATGCTAGNRVSAGSAQTFRTIPNAGPAVALTFDMGGRMDPAVDIMNFLVSNGVCATIFATGVMSNTPQGQQVLALIKAHPELFEVGNHTMYHCDLVRGGGGSPTTAPCTGSFDANRIRKELTDAEAILRAGTGQNPQPYWRPPYGSISQGVIDAAASAGYTKAFLWDIDSIDWKPISDGGPTAEQMAAKVIGNAVNGSNVLFHIGGYETLEALHLIIPGLRDRGFTLTSLSDLLN
ncbi:MAG TPA: polysaccharide deacetylase family protein [Candidatus Limnocylindria bacterium]|nr:polysaccharide deacetylase family protein [Candidatus Limnocylindria bacterium]